jgi:RNA polymerase sigma factor (sigma-70 family)
METIFNESQVIREILNGDKNKYCLLIQKYNRRLYRICKGYLRDEAEIEDIMQDTYIKGYENLYKFEERSQFGTWITRILINESLQRIRSINKRSNVTQNNSNNNIMNITDHINPETRSLNKEFRSLLEQKIETLPENYRLVFLMREVEKMNVAETAETLMISESNVKVRLNRAKEMLKKSLLETYPLEELYEFNLERCGRIAANVMAHILLLRSVNIPQ